MKTVLDEHFSRRRAARWFARLRSGEVSESTDSAFRRWLERHPSHERDLERAELLWSLLGDLENDSEVAKWTQSARDTTGKPGSDPAPVAARLPSGRRWSSLFVAASASAIALVGGFIWVVVPRHTSTQREALLEPPAQIFRTSVGEHRSVTLGDGSTVELNTATRLHVRYTDRIRQVTLDEGEALFVVHHDTRRPFDVTAGHTLTRAVGTAFNVLSLNGKTQIAVLEGRVQVTAPSVTSLQSIPKDTPPSLQPILLAAGHATTYTDQTGLGPITDADLDRIQSWQSGHLEFHDVSLGEAVRDFNRYSTIHMVIGDRALETIRLSGVFRAGDVTSFTGALRGGFGIAAQHPDAETVVLVPVSAAGSRR